MTGKDEMKNFWRTFFLVLLLGGWAGCSTTNAPSSTVAAAATNSFDREILAFEARDRTNPPPRDAVLFIGSSSVRMWKNVAQDFPQYPVINRGFGGSQISDSIHFADRIVAPYRPRLIVFYAGGNDIHAKKSPQRVADDFKTFVQVVRRKLPSTPITYISIAPNPSRWAEVTEVREANRLIREFTTREKGLSFVDVFPLMLGPDGLPLPDIYLADKLHMNPKGYAIWRGPLSEHLARVLGPGTRK